MWTSAALSLTAGAAAAMLLVPVARRLSAALGLVAHPVDDRWHSRSVGKLGGVAMAMACAAVWPWTGMAQSFQPLLLGSLLIAALGLVDDVRPIRPASKLLGQILVAALFLYLLPSVTFTGQVLVDYGLAFIWLVGLTNAFNLLDNIDGLAGGIAGIAAGCLALSLLHAGVPAVEPLALALLVFAGVCLGFLCFNFKPASIFMGDSGSHLLGFFVSGAALSALPHLNGRELWPSIAGPIFTLLIPIFDTTFVTITRGMAGRGVFQGGRDHTSHRLVLLGISERRAVLVLYALACAGGAVGWILQGGYERFGWGLALLYVTSLVGLGLYLGHLDASRRDGVEQRPHLPTELTTRYRAAEVALDAVIIAVAYYLAFGIRFSEPEFSHFLPYFAQSVPVVLGLQLGGLALAGKYRQIWHTFGWPEAVALLRGIGIGIAGTLVAVLYLYRFEGFSRAVFAYDALLLSAFLLATRAGIGTVDEFLRRRRAGGQGALILGAGRGGALAVRELLQNPQLELVPVGFLDDDPEKAARRIDGYRVLGRLSDLDQVLRQPTHHIALVVLTIDGLPPAVVDTIHATCAHHAVPVRRLRFSIDDTFTRPRGGVVAFPKR